jgi:hypothetical protein
MEQMPYYLPPEEGWKKHFEGLIPILILILIAIVLVGKTTNLFCTVPGFTDIFCAKGMITVGLLGNFGEDTDTQIKANLFKAVLDADGAKFNIQQGKIWAAGLEFPQEAALAKYDVVIVAGNRDLTLAARQALGNYIANGGKVLLIGDAGVFDPKDNMIKGWTEGSFGDYSPIRLNIQGPISGKQLPSVTIADANMNYFDDTNPIVKYYAYQYQLNFSEVNRSECSTINTLDVFPLSGADIVGVLSNGDDSKSVPAIVEKKAGLFGNGDVVYFNFDPGCMRNAVIATMRYLAGKG